MLRSRVEQLLSKLEIEDRQLVEHLLAIAEESKSLVEQGSGSYALMKVVVGAYAPETVNLYLWSR